MTYRAVPRINSIHGRPISRIGIGTLHLSLDPRPSLDDAIAVIHRALLHGITLIDTADSYCRDEIDKNHNEELIRKALEAYGRDADCVLVATKGGMIRPQGQWVACGDPRYLEKAIVRSHRALGGQKPIDLWQYHVPDPKYDFVASLKTAVAAVRHGLIRWIGLSNVSLEQIKQAQDVIEIASVQNLYNPWNRDAEFNGILDHCARNNMIFLAWSPLGGKQHHQELSRNPYLVHLSAEKKVSHYSLVLAWLMSRSLNIIPIPGTIKPSHISTWVEACYLTLTPAEIHRMDCSFYREPHWTSTTEMRLTTQSDACLLC